MKVLQEAFEQAQCLENDVQNMFMCSWLTVRIISHIIYHIMSCGSDIYHLYWENLNSNMAGFPATSMTCLQHVMTSYGMLGHQCLNSIQMYLLFLETSHGLNGSMSRCFWKLVNVICWSADFCRMSFHPAPGAWPIHSQDVWTAEWVLSLTLALLTPTRASWESQQTQWHSASWARECTGVKGVKGTSVRNIVSIQI